MLRLWTARWLSGPRKAVQQIVWAFCFGCDDWALLEGWVTKESEAAQLYDAKATSKELLWLWRDDRTSDGVLGD